MANFLGITFFAALLGISCAMAHDGGTDARVDSILGDPETYSIAFAELQDGIRRNDRQKVAALVRYPITIRVEGRRKMIGDARDFVAQYDRIVTPDIAAAVSAQNWDDVLVTTKGIMIGDGEVWLNGICRDTLCRMFDARVVTIQKVDKR